MDTSEYRTTDLQPSITPLRKGTAPMGTPIGKTTTVIPSIKLRNIGDYIDVALIDCQAVPWNEFSGPRKGMQKMTADGKPRTQDKVTALVVKGGGAVTTRDDIDVPVEPDELVSIFIAGHRRWDFIEAQRKVDGGLQCGDIMRIKYARDEPGQGAEPKKVWEYQIRHPKPDEAGQAQRCEDLRIAGQAPAGGTPIGGPADYDDEEPF